jgi:glycosyltransferase involved in cell wall biosynthesis
MPLLSIIIPVFNSEKTIATTLDSLKGISNESRSSVEVIVVNDGTADGSMAVVESRKTALKPLSMVVVTQSNQGLASARNAGLEHSSGEYVFFLDADDELDFDPVPFLQNNPGASAIGFSVRYENNTSLQNVKRPVRITTANHLDIFTAENALTVSSVIFQKSRISSPFDTTLFSLEDWHFWMTNPSIFGGMTVFPEVVSAKIHMHGENMTLNVRTMGKYREKVAQMMVEQYRDRLTGKQRNNLLIQSSIGLRQQGKPISWKTFLLIPCNGSLYGKLVVYALSKSAFR